MPHQVAKFYWLSSSAERNERQFFTALSLVSFFHCQDRCFNGVMYFAPFRSWRSESVKAQKHFFSTSKMRLISSAIRPLAILHANSFWLWYHEKWNLQFSRILQESSTLLKVFSYLFQMMVLLSLCCANVCIISEISSVPFNSHFHFRFDDEVLFSFLEPID